MKPNNRKPRTRQVVPSAARRKELYRLLDRQADSGNVEAAGWLLFLAESREAHTAHA